MSKEWIATYRLQLRREFPFVTAAEILPYLAELGISHVYISPVLEAEPGSQHGYDGTDPTRISGDLGGEEGWKAFREAAKTHGLGVLLDIVPNHMAVSPANPWWEDVLARGPFSRRASHFDIFEPETAGRWKVRLSTLSAPVPELLAANKFTVRISERGPRLYCGDQSWPLALHSWRHFLPLGEALASTFEDLRLLSVKSSPLPSDVSRWQELEQTVQLKSGMLHPDVTEWGAIRMEALLSEQFYELHSWREASTKLNYRRFFAVDSLVGVRTEDPAVFSALHGRVAKMVEEREIEGLRIDHPDGLSDPEYYLTELRSLFPNIPIYVEKILSGDEFLPEGWPVDGTVGYDFLTRVNSLWVDERRLEEITRVYTDFTGCRHDYEELVMKKKRMVVNILFPRELDYLTNLAAGIAYAQVNRESFGREEIKTAIRELSVRVPVYRTYKTERGISGKDRTRILELFAAARASTPSVKGEVFDLLERILLGKHSSRLEKEFTTRWQQFTGPVAAKGVEDTVFYTYNRMIAVNEVGGNPELGGNAVEAFHAYCLRIAKSWPRNLLLTASHDTKRGEDVRARLAVLSELPGLWAEHLERWRASNLQGWNGYPPDRNMEFYLYQTLVGAWPLEEERCRAHMLKACREAATETTWLTPNESYEKAVGDFIGYIYSSDSFLTGLRSCIDKLEPHGRVNSLAQTLIKLTAPGVPDFYQGCELPEFSLVDPDNRRSVDFIQRGLLLSGINHKDGPPDPAAPEAKLWMIHKTLQLRRAHPEWFGPTAGYEPVEITGGCRSHVVAFRRGIKLITAVPRLQASSLGRCGNAALVLPPGQWKSEFSGEIFEGEVDAERVFARFPVALLHQKNP